MIDRILAMNAAIEARLRPAPQYVDPDYSDHASYLVASAEWKEHWRDAFGAGSDDLRRAAGLVRCADAPGWRFA
jgi:hypothetical protein